MKLEFGNPEHIKLRDNYIMDQHIKRLTQTVRCPFCGAKVLNAYDYSLENEYIGWNFYCKPTCLNSIEMSAEVSPDVTNTFTDLQGNFLED